MAGITTSKTSHRLLPAQARPSRVGARIIRGTRPDANSNAWITGMVPPAPFPLAGERQQQAAFSLAASQVILHRADALPNPDSRPVPGGAFTIFMATWLAQHRRLTHSKTTAPRAPDP